MSRRKNEVQYCKAPDRDVPKLVCGYPLPCPDHTVVVVINEKKPIRVKRGKLKKR